MGSGESKEKIRQRRKGDPSRNTKVTRSDLKRVNHKGREVLNHQERALNVEIDKEESKKGMGPRTKEAPKMEITLLDLKRVHDNGVELLKKQKARLEVESDKASELMVAEYSEQAKIIIMQNHARQVYINQLHGQLENIENAITRFDAEPMNVYTMASYVIASRALDRLNALMSVKEVRRINSKNGESLERLRKIGESLAQDITPAEIEWANVDYDVAVEFMEYIDVEFDLLVESMNKQENATETEEDQMMRLQELMDGVEDKIEAAAVPPQPDAEESERNRDPLDVLPETS
jgi:DNA uptake protein ComE-like DNA-binding protein